MNTPEHIVRIRAGLPAVATAAALALLMLPLHPAAPASGAEVVEIELPPGVLPLEIPEDNPLTRERIELGRKLYFDTRLSTDGTVACVTCHNPRTGFADQRGGAPTSAGVGGALGARNAPTVLNAAFLVDQFWDGRAQGLEEQAVQPLQNPIEHGFADAASVVKHIQGLKDYPPAFRTAFGDARITLERIGQAIAAFERTLVSLDAPIDRFLAGDRAAISESAARGWELFNGKARCNNCHGHVDVLPLFTDELYHNLGVGAENFDFEGVARRVRAAVQAGASLDELALADAEATELGRFIVTFELKDLGAFKTPPLRNVALTAPYMHDGSEATLEDVMAFYNRGGNQNPFLDGGMAKLELTAQEEQDLVALMHAFTSSDLDRFDELAAQAPR